MKKKKKKLKFMILELIIIKLGGDLEPGGKPLNLIIRESNCWTHFIQMNK